MFIVNDGIFKGDVEIGLHSKENYSGIKMILKNPRIRNTGFGAKFESKNGSACISKEDIAHMDQVDVSSRCVSYYVSYSDGMEASVTLRGIGA